MRTRVVLVLGLASLMLAACGDDGGTLTTTEASTSITSSSQATTTETQAATTTEPLVTTTTPGTTLAEGVVRFSGEGAFASQPFSLPGPSTRYVVEMTASHIGDGWCGMVVRIEKEGPFGPEDVYWWLTYTTPDGPSTDFNTQELVSDVLPSDEFRLFTEPSSEDLDDCSWEVTLRPA